MRTADTHGHHHARGRRVELLHWIAGLGAVTAEALALRENVTLASARARLSIAARHDMVVRVRPLAAAPALFVLTRAGLKAAEGHDLASCRVSASGARHLIACAQVAAALERCYPDHRVSGERELRRDERGARRELASARLAGRWGAPSDGSSHRPDLVLWPADRTSLPVAVEVELTVKAPPRLAAICTAWARCQHVAGVLYLVSDRADHAVRRAVASAHADEQIAVVSLATLVGEAFQRTVTGAA